MKTRTKDTLLELACGRQRSLSLVQQKRRPPPLGPVRPPGRRRASHRALQSLPWSSISSRKSSSHEGSSHCLERTMVRHKEKRLRGRNVCSQAKASGRKAGGQASCAFLSHHSAQLQARPPTHGPAEDRPLAASLGHHWLGCTPSMFLP